MATDSVCTEIKGTISGRRSLNTGRTIVRRFRVDAKDNGKYRTPLAASLHPDVPQLGKEFNDAGNTHSLQHEEHLIVQDIGYEHVPESKHVTDVTCTYSERTGRLMVGLVGRRWTIGTRSVNQDVDMDGKIAGRTTFNSIWEDGVDISGDVPLNDPRWQDIDARVGADVLVPEVYFDMRFPCGHDGTLPDKVPYQVATRTADLTIVHGGPGVTECFQGHPPGTIQYIGFEAEEVGPFQGGFEWTHHYRVGRITLQHTTGGSDLSVDLAHTYLWTFKSVNGDREPLEPYLVRLYDYGDLNAMFPG